MKFVLDTLFVLIAMRLVALAFRPVVHARAAKAVLDQKQATRPDIVVTKVAKRHHSRLKDSDSARNVFRGVPGNGAIIGLSERTWPKGANRCEKHWLSASMEEHLHSGLSFTIRPAMMSRTGP